MITVSLRKKVKFGTSAKGEGDPVSPAEGLERWLK